MHAFSLWIGTAALLIVAGCATDANFIEGKRLLSEGKTEQGLLLLDKAARDNPRALEMRAVWARERDRSVNRLLAQGDTARSQNLLVEAHAAYREVQGIDPGNARARSGIDAVAQANRHESRMREAEGLVAKNNLPEAEALVRKVLAENPNHYGARALSRRITDAVESRSVAAPVLKAATGKPVNLQFRDANLRSVFEVISNTTGVNFVFDKDVRPDLRTTLIVRNSTVDDVIKLVLVTNQLERKVLNDNTILVYPNTPAKLKEYQELVVRTFYLANADVKQIVNMIRSVVKTRDLYVDEKLNILVMKDTADAVRMAEKLIAAQDLAESEVVLELEVLEIGSSRALELGVKFPQQVQFQSAASAVAGASIQRASDTLTGFIATPALLLNLKQQDGTTNVLANPRIRVKNREKAKVHIGDKVPVITTTSTANVGVSASVTYLDVGLKLDVEPTIMLEGDVVIKAGLEVSNIVKEVPVTGGGLAYQVGTRNASTVLRLRDGETQVLAGLIQDEDRVTASKLPGLGNLPVMGRLFSSNKEDASKTEIVLLITPRVVRTVERPEHVVVQFSAGTESAIGAAPLAIGSTLAGSIALSNAPGKAEARLPIRADTPVPSQDAPAALATLAMNVSEQAKVGTDVVVSLGLSGDPRAANAQLEVVYDAAVLAPRGAGPGAVPGRVPVNLSRGGNEAPASTKISFQVIAKSAINTQLALENAVVRETGGAAVPVAMPPAVSIQIVQ